VAPIPARGITVVLPEAASLAIVRDPDAAAAVVGAKLTLMVAVCPGLIVMGRLAPEMAKPVPVTVAEEIVNGAVPLESSVTDSVLVEPVATVPKLRESGLATSVALAAFSCSVKAFDTLPACAVKVTA
jgi:hypothetical protein